MYFKKICGLEIHSFNNNTVNKLKSTFLFKFPQTEKIVPQICLAGNTSNFSEKSFTEPGQLSLK